jgi:GTP-binding protein LepA
MKDLSTVINMYLPRTSFGDGNNSKSVMYASVHPFEGEGFDELASAVEKLALNDTGLEVQKTAGNSNNDGGPFLGPGLLIGFQGLLHVEVFQQRLADEHGMEAIVTPPKGKTNQLWTESSTFPSNSSALKKLKILIFFNP